MKRTELMLIVLAMGAVPSVHAAPAKGAGVFSCNLVAQAGQCREYSVAESATEVLESFSSGCVSMGGTFAARACPAENRISRCLNVIRGQPLMKEILLKTNFHSPNDVIYHNHYYPGGDAQWTLDAVRQTCAELDGVLTEP